MKNVKISVGIMSLLIIAAMSLASCSNTANIVDKANDEADNATYITEYSMEYIQKSIDELVASSALIVRANMVDIMPSEKRNELVVTDHIFEILEVYSGDKKAGDKITVEMLGGVLNDTKYVANGERGVQSGDEVILILSYPTDENDKIISTDYYVYYPRAGIYYKNDKVSMKDGEQFVANDSSRKLNTSTIQAQIDEIYAVAKASVE